MRFAPSSTARRKIACASSRGIFVIRIALEAESVHVELATEAERCAQGNTPSSSSDSAELTRVSVDAKRAGAGQLVLSVAAAEHADAEHPRPPCSEQVPDGVADDVTLRRARRRVARRRRGRGPARALPARHHRARPRPFPPDAERFERGVDLWPPPRGRDPVRRLRRSAARPAARRPGQRPSLGQQLAEELAVAALDRLDLVGASGRAHSRATAARRGRHSSRSAGGCASRRSACPPRRARAATRTRARRPCRRAFRPGRRSSASSRTPSASARRGSRTGRGRRSAAGRRSALRRSSRCRCSRPGRATRRGHRPRSRTEVPRVSAGSPTCIRWSSRSPPTRNQHQLGRVEVRRHVALLQAEELAVELDRLCTRLVAAWDHDRDVLQSHRPRRPARRTRARRPPQRPCVTGPRAAPARRSSPPTRR